MSKTARYKQGHDARVAPKVEEFLKEHGLADLKELFQRYVELERRS